MTGIRIKLKDDTITVKLSHFIVFSICSLIVLSKYDWWFTMVSTRNFLLTKVVFGMVYSFALGIMGLVYGGLAIYSIRGRVELL